MEIFNPMVLNEWKEIDPEEWRAMVKEIVDLFLDTVDAKYESLQKSVKNKKLEDARDIAHAMKSSFGNIGAARAQGILQSAEQAASKGDLHRLSVALVQFEEVFGDTIGKLREYKSQL